MNLTLMQIELVLHYYYSPDEHPYVVAHTAGCQQAINGLLQAGLLERCTDDHRNFKTTDKATVYVESIRNLPQPVQKTEWVMPT
jgi:cytochrome c-type biogenesis protein CcmE